MGADAYYGYGYGVGILNNNVYSGFHGNHYANGLPGRSFAAVTRGKRSAEAEAEADPYYGHGYGYGHHLGYGYGHHGGYYGHGYGFGHGYGYYVWTRPRTCVRRPSSTGQSPRVTCTRCSG